MTRDTCRYPSCNRRPGAQDREGYNAHRFCSVKCEVRFDHIKADAADARASVERHHDDAPRHDRGGRRL